VIVEVSLLEIGSSPSCRIELGLGVPLRAKEDGKVSEACLEGQVAIGSSSSEADVAIAMDEDYGFFFDGVRRASFTSEGCAFDIRPVKAPNFIV
jgi:hypothetical protein